MNEPNRRDVQPNAIKPMSERATTMRERLRSHSKTTAPSRSRLVPLCMAMVLSVGPGCWPNLGKGGSGEFVAPPQRLHSIEGTDLADLSTIAPTSEPTSQPTTQPVGPPPAELSLTLGEVRELALKFNLDLGVELLNPDISATSISEEEARFEALFSTNANYVKSDAPTASQLNSNQAENFSLDTAVSVPLRTGGTLNFAVPVNRFESDNAFNTLNPAYESDFAFSFSQPLLRGGGVWTNAQRIRVAFYAYQRTEARTKLEVIRVLADAERVYWRLYAAREELKVRQQEYDLAVKLLERARRLVGAGAQAEVEIIRAESGVADQLSNIIVAENNVRDRQRDLKRTLNKPDLPMGSPTIIIPGTEPRPLHYLINGDQLADAAMDKRMEMLELELQIAADTSNIDFAKNDLLPLVALNYTYNINGLGSTLDDAFALARKNDFADHTLGLQIQIPIGNQAARSRYRRAILNRLQSLATRDQRAAQIRQEVYNAVDQLEANWQRILAARTRAVLATRLVNAENRQFELGLRTATDVLQAQSNLATALSDQVAAVTEYQISQIDVAFATGTLLGASRVVWDVSSPTRKVAPN